MVGPLIVGFLLCPPRSTLETAVNTRTHVVLIASMLMTRVNSRSVK